MILRRKTPTKNWCTLFLSQTQTGYLIAYCTHFIEYVSKLIQKFSDSIWNFLNRNRYLLRK